MCMRNDCSFVQIVELHTGEKCFIHYHIDKSGKFIELFWEGDKRAYEDYLKDFNN